MAQFASLQEIGEKVKELTEKLKNDNLTRDELEMLEKYAQHLYQRATILNFKAKEEQVFGVEETETEEESAVEETADNQEREEVEKEATVSQETAPETKVEEEFSFDFSGGFDTPLTETEETKESSKINSLEEKKEKEIAAEKPEDKKIEQEEIEAEKSNFVQEKVSETLSSNGDDNVDIASYYQHFYAGYRQAIGDKISTSKIDSIKSAVGLNDKLQFINELFNGDADLFNQTIEKLDHFSEAESALRNLSQIAVQQKWDKEETVVQEFAHIINRRYVV